MTLITGRDGTTSWAEPLANSPHNKEEYQTWPNQVQAENVGHKTSLHVQGKHTRLPHRISHWNTSCHKKCTLALLLWVSYRQHDLAQPNLAEVGSSFKCKQAGLFKKCLTSCLIGHPNRSVKQILCGHKLSRLQCPQRSGRSTRKPKQATCNCTAQGPKFLPTCSHNKLSGQTSKTQPSSIWQISALFHDLAPRSCLAQCAYVHCKNSSTFGESPHNQRPNLGVASTFKSKRITTRASGTLKESIMEQRIFTRDEQSATVSTVSMTWCIHLKWPSATQATCDWTLVLMDLKPLKSRYDLKIPSQPSHNGQHSRSFTST